MITNKDIRVENGNLVLNGDKYPLDGQSPETIMEIVEDNSDTTPTENSTAPVTSGGVFTALGTKQDTLTFDSAPTDESTNPVTSGGVYNTIGDLTQTGITGASVAAQLEAIGDQLDIEHVTNLSIDTSKITIGNYDCYVKAGVCYLSLYSCSFPASGSISASISNAPKALLQALSSGYGSSANAADLISEYCWIAGDSTTISFTVSEANKSKNRDYYLVYPVATS